MDSVSKATPYSALGMNFHGGGGGFMNNTASSVHEDSVGWVFDGDLADDTWFKFTYTLTYQGGDIFDAEFLIEESDANGNIVEVWDDTQSIAGLSNSSVGAAAIIYPYFGNDGSRMDRMDDFYANDSGANGAVPEPAGLVLALLGIVAIRATTKR